MVLSQPARFDSIGHSLLLVFGASLTLASFNESVFGSFSLRHRPVHL
jgi:hypothetical protein